jgi:hypothetical protein
MMTSGLRGVVVARLRGGRNNRTTYILTAYDTRGWRDLINGEVLIDTRMRNTYGVITS